MTVWKRGKVWYLDFRLDGKRYVKRVGPSREAAQEAERVARAEALAGRYEREWGLRSKPKPLSVTRFLTDHYLPTVQPTLAPATFVTVRDSLRRFMTVCGDTLLPQLGRTQLEQYVATRSQRLRATTLHTELGWIRRALETAKRQGYCHHNPAAGLRLPRVRPRDYRLLSREDERRLFRAIRRPVIQAMVRLLLLTGLRRGEVCALRWAHVDLPGARLTFVQPKTGRVKRLPLVPEAVTLLKGLRPGPATDADRPVFLNQWDRPFHGNTLWLAFAAARQRAQLSGLRLHDLRHTVAMRLIHQRVDLATVGEILGHSPPYRETLRYAAHTSEDRLRSALAGLQTSHQRKK